MRHIASNARLARWTSKGKPEEESEYLEIIICLPQANPLLGGVERCRERRSHGLYTH
jgi:hypothetical protein